MNNPIKINVPIVLHLNLQFEVRAPTSEVAVTVTRETQQSYLSPISPLHRSSPSSVPSPATEAVATATEAVRAAVPAGPQSLRDQIVASPLNGAAAARHFKVSRSMVYRTRRAARKRAATVEKAAAARPSPVGLRVPGGVS